MSAASELSSCARIVDLGNWQHVAVFFVIAKSTVLVAVANLVPLNTPGSIFAEISSTEFGCAPESLVFSIWAIVGSVADISLVDAEGVPVGGSALELSTLTNCSWEWLNWFAERCFIFSLSAVPNSIAHAVGRDTRAIRCAHKLLGSTSWWRRCSRSCWAEVAFVFSGLAVPFTIADVLFRDTREVLTCELVRFARKWAGSSRWFGSAEFALVVTMETIPSSIANEVMGNASSIKTHETVRHAEISRRHRRLCWAETSFIFPTDAIPDSVADVKFEDTITVDTGEHSSGTFRLRNFGCRQWVTEVTLVFAMGAVPYFVAEESI